LQQAAAEFGFGIRIQMCMHVDQPRQHRRLPRVDNARRQRQSVAADDIGDPAPGDVDVDVVPIAGRNSVEQPLGLNDERLRRHRLPPAQPVIVDPDRRARVAGYGIRQGCRFVPICQRRKLAGYQTQPPLIDATVTIAGENQRFTVCGESRCKVGPGVVGQTDQLAVVDQPEIGERAERRAVGV